MDRGEVVDARQDLRKSSIDAASYQEHTLITALRLFVAVSGLRVTRIAQLMGVGEATLAKWLAPSLPENGVVLSGQYGFC